MRFTVTVLVRPKEGLRDPEGGAVQHALEALGYRDVHQVHVGKVVELGLDAADSVAATQTALEMCERILANPVIEEFEVTVVEALGTGAVIVAIPLLPGVNTEHDTVVALARCGTEAAFVHHRDTALPADTGAVWIPGGFSYGDYLRAGAIPRFAPVVGAIGAAAAEGMPVLGVCNGFQVLCEAGLLPGALARNVDARFLCRDVDVRVESAGTVATAAARPGVVLRIPINHGEGSYTAEAAVLDRLEADDRVVFRYCAPDGGVDETDRATNPNGSLRAIAGVTNAARNVVGMMPHPERAVDLLLGSADGLAVVESLVASAEVPHVRA